MYRCLQCEGTLFAALVRLVSVKGGLIAPQETKFFRCANCSTVYEPAQPAETTGEAELRVVNER